MPLLIALAQTGAVLFKWTAMVVALAVIAANPAPRRATHRHHQPIILPELADAGPLIP